MPDQPAEGLTAGQLGASAGPCALWGAWTRGAAGPGTPWAVPGQCLTKLHGEGPAAAYELLVANDLQKHAPPAAGRRSGPGMGAGRMGHGGHGLHAPPSSPPAASRSPQQSSRTPMAPLAGQARAGQTRPVPRRPPRQGTSTAPCGLETPFGGSVLWHGGRSAPRTRTWRQLGPPRSLRGPLTRWGRRQETHRAARPIGRDAGESFRKLGGPVCWPRQTDAGGPRTGPGRPG